MFVKTDAAKFSIRLLNTMMPMNYQQLGAASTNEKKVIS